MQSIFEEDFLRFLIEHQIPIPKQLFNNHAEERKNLKKLPGIIYTSRDIKFDTWNTPNTDQPQVTKALKNLCIGNVLTLGAQDADILIHAASPKASLSRIPDETFEDTASYEKLLNLEEIPSEPFLRIQKIDESSYALFPLTDTMQSKSFPSIRIYDPRQKAIVHKMNKEEATPYTMKSGEILFINGLKILNEVTDIKLSGSKKPWYQKVKTYFLQKSLVKKEGEACQAFFKIP